MDHVIDLRLPANYAARHFWMWREDKAVGLVTAFNARCWVIGFEIIAGDCRGLAISIGPLWLGIAVYTAALATPAREGDKGNR